MFCAAMLMNNSLAEGFFFYRGRCCVDIIVSCRLVSFIAAAYETMIQ